MEVGEFLSAGLNGVPLVARPEPLEASPEPVELPETVRLGLLPARLDSVGFFGPRKHILARHFPAALATCLCSSHGSYH